ncbi:MAG: MgtC/SapB family protein [Bdellovibrionota bacterium]
MQFETALSNLWHLLVAYLLALPIGWEREKNAESAGLRTFPLVAVGACGFMLTGASVLSGDEAYSRLMYGLMTGIGFIGGGAILKVGREAHGTATAASLWNVGAIGMAVAWNRFEIAFVLTAINFVTLELIRPIKSRMGSVQES